jgi:8-oxo-dGTP pyrophosphatase MutT (NUDIX family)
MSHKFRWKFYFLKLFWFFARPIRKLYWIICRPKTRGVKCIIQHGNKVLFVKLSYAHKSWTLPGGRVDKGESFEEAARREAKEETGIVLGEVEMVSEYLNTKEYKIDTVQCFSAKVDSDYFKIDNIEIVDAKWAIVTDLPTPHPQRLEKVISDFVLH